MRAVEGQDIFSHSGIKSGERISTGPFNHLPIHGFIRQEVVESKENIGHKESLFATCKISQQRGQSTVSLLL